MTTLADLKEELALLNDYWRRRNRYPQPEDEEDLMWDMEDRMDAFEKERYLEREIARIEGWVL